MHALSLTLAPDQVIGVSLSAPAEVSVLAQIAASRMAAEAKAKAEADVLARTYHLGSKATAGRGFDDRLTVRIGIGATLLREQIALWQQHGGKRGGLRFLRFGTKYIITEEDVCDFLRRNPKKAAA